MAPIRARLVKWGNSLAVRIPKTVLDEARMKEGEEIEIRAERGRIALEPASPKLTLKALVARIRPANLHGEQPWGERVGNEPW
jgi:antitoxin MazE